ncbi:MAG: hypothetical protein V2A74_01785 [bacterium]
MKKGLFLTLLITAIALVGKNPSYAFAPAISHIRDIVVGVQEESFATGDVNFFAPVIGNIPDIVVGDAEDNGATIGSSFFRVPTISVGVADLNSATVDNNFFRFPNALNFLDYVQDQDTPTTAIRWSFMEADDSTSVSINGMLQLSAGDDPVAPPPAKELTSGLTDFYADFRLESLSPSSGFPPFPNPGVTSGTLFFNRLVTLFATDGASTDSKTITVYAIENGFDGYRFAQPPTSVILSHNFTSTTEGATPLSFTVPTAQPQPFSGSTTSFAGGRLGLISPNNGSNYFGSWNSTPSDIPYTADKLHRARWEVTTDQATVSAVPSARFRISSQADNVNVGSYSFNAANTDTNVPPVMPVTRTYSQYFQPVDLTSLQSNSLTAGMKWFFDLIDFSPTVSGSLFLDSIVVEALDRPTSGTTDASITTFDATEWSSLGGSTLFPAWQNATSSGIGTEAFSWTVASGSTAAIGVFQNSGATSPPFIPLTAGKLYRAVFSLSIGNSADRAHAPRVRLRLQDANGETASEYDIFKGQGGLATPDTTTTPYDVYLVGPSNSGTPLNGSLGFDIIAFDPTEAGTIRLEQIDVSSDTQP